jgi:hypothetical protein
MLFVSFWYKFLCCQFSFAAEMMILIDVDNNRKMVCGIVGNGVAISNIIMVGRTGRLVKERRFGVMIVLMLNGSNNGSGGFNWDEMARIVGAWIRIGWFIW